jgi:hypothetical protein
LVKKHPVNDGARKNLNYSKFEKRKNLVIEDDDEEDNNDDVEGDDEVEDSDGCNDGNENAFEKQSRKHRATNLNQFSSSPLDGFENRYISTSHGASSTTTPITTEDLEVRISKLESEVSLLINLSKRNLVKNSSETSLPKELTTWQESYLGTFVRTKMFRAIKYLDNLILARQGEQIFERALKICHFKDEEIGNKAVEDVLLKRMRHYLTNHRCHVVADFRKKAMSEYIVFLYSITHLFSIYF